METENIYRKSDEMPAVLWNFPQKMLIYRNVNMNELHENGDSSPCRLTNFITLTELHLPPQKVVIRLSWRRKYLVIKLFVIEFYITSG